MAYSELIKNFDRIRDYMRQFYIYGFKSRTEYDKKSARSYDNERRRIESWLGDFMRFRQTPDGKNVFLSVDSRSIPGNPFYNAFKAKSFTTGDVTFHFYVLDILQPGASYTVQEILDIIFDKNLCHFESEWQPDISTIRKKLKEYVSLGILKAEKRGRELYYGLDPNVVYEADGRTYNIMRLIMSIDNEYIAADTMRLLLDNGGDPNLTAGIETIFECIDYDVWFGSVEQEIRWRYDAWVHVWMVLLAYGGEIPGKGQMMEAFRERHSDDLFDLKKLRNHRDYFFGLSVENKGRTMHIYDKKTFWEVARW